MLLVRQHSAPDSTDVLDPLRAGQRVTSCGMGHTAQHMSKGCLPTGQGAAWRWDSQGAAQRGHSPIGQHHRVQSLGSLRSLTTLLESDRQPAGTPKEPSRHYTATHLRTSYRHPAHHQIKGIPVTGLTENTQIKGELALGFPCSILEAPAGPAARAAHRRPAEQQALSLCSYGRLSCQLSTAEWNSVGRDH